MFEESIAQYLMIVVAALTVLLPLIAGKFGIPVLVLISRWLRWVLFAVLFAYFLKLFELSYRPDWVHFVSGFALWFILETGYNWMAIKALSHSDLPLFPSFSVNADGDEWPADAHSIKVKDWLRAQGYQRLNPLKAELFEGAYLRASFYESADHLTRIQILFLPKAKGGVAACYSLSTLIETGERVITDNFFLPYGGYYPSDWNICRRPLMGSLQRLENLHKKRLKKMDAQAILVDNTALEEINEQQRILERYNTESGFLVARPQQEEEGRLTADGRFRLWKEMWMLAYFAKSLA